MGRVLVTRRLTEGGTDPLLRDGHELIEPERAPSTDELVAYAGEVDGVVCHLTDRIDRAVFEAGRAGRLQVVANAAVGYDNMDVASAQDCGISVCNTPGVLDDTTADLAFLLILTASRQSTQAEEDLRAGRWTGWGFDTGLARDVYGTTLGLVGYGRIGRAVAQRAAGFDMEVLHTTRHDTGVPGYVASLHELLQRSDIVSLHVPLSDTTRHLIGAAELAQMKPTAVLVNTARGAVVDENALVDALEAGTLYAAGLDVFDGEPSINPRWLKAPRVTLLPHVGSATIGTRTRMARLACQGVADVLAGRTPPNLIVPTIDRSNNRSPPGFCSKKGRSHCKKSSIHSLSQRWKPLREEKMQTLRTFAVSALCNITALIAVGVLGVSLASSPAGAVSPQWQTTASFAPLVNVRAVSCAPNSTPSTTTCVAVGDNGNGVPSIIATDDGGSTWNGVQAPQGTSAFASVSCPTDTVCYSSADTGIFKSTDSGNSWTLSDPSFPAQSISCFTADECTAVDGSAIDSTVDGSTWSAQISPGGTSDLSGVSCPNAVTCVAIGLLNGNPAILGTQNDSTWTTLDPNPGVGALSAISCGSAADCVAVGSSLQQHATSVDSNGLTSWSLTGSIPSGGSLNAVSCIGGSCFAVGTNSSSVPYAVESANNGSAWTSQTMPSNAVDLTGISCASDINCVAVSGDGLTGSGSIAIGTTNGASWVGQTIPFGTGDFNSVSCQGSNDCFAAGINSVVTSTNRGRTWEFQSVPTEVDGLNGLSCPSVLNCTAVGFGPFGIGTIAGTTNGGANWTAETVPSGTETLVGVACASTSVCQAVSSPTTGSPSIIGTVNGGANWTTETIPGDVLSLTAIACPDSLTCVALGTTSTGAAIIATANGGANWSHETVPSGVTTLNGVSCSSDASCLAVGSAVLSTGDGGSQWNNLGNPLGATALSSISCLNAATCTAVGGANIVQTADGGSAWSPQAVPADVSSLVSVNCVGPANCVAGGSGTNGGGLIVSLIAPPTVTTTALPGGAIGVPYASSLNATGGLAPYSWSMTAGSLPPGLQLTTGGTISGSPTLPGDYSFTATVTDSNQLSAGTTLSVDVGAVGAPGYWEVGSDGGIFSYGGAPFYGSTGGLHLNAPIVSMAATPNGAGYWLLASDGGIFAFGDAVFYGSTGGMHLNAPIVAMEPTPDGGGYWLVASDGGIFSYGDAAFYGSTGALKLDKPIVGMASTTDGHGYWLVASDGGVFSFGDAHFDGSAGGLPLQKPIVGMAAAPDGGGYWLVASDGGIFSFGDVGYFGSTGGLPLSAPIVGMEHTADGQGYWLVGRDGGLFSFGDAAFYGSAGGLHLNEPVVGMAAIQTLGSRPT